MHFHGAEHITVHAPQNTERTLKLIAKVIQNLANVCPFGEKEPFMKQLNPFIDNRMDEMKGYLNHISVRVAVCIVERS